MLIFTKKYKVVVGGHVILISKTNCTMQKSKPWCKNIKDLFISNKMTNVFKIIHILMAFLE